MKRTAANIDKEVVRWSLSWLPDGRCETFTREAILAWAPRTSGVYGLFNFDCQVFIGESANIQEALLCHESETDFQSRHLRPTGFTFETCAAELRKPKADELIARFQPVLQTEAALTETWSPSNGQKVTEVRLSGQELETDYHEFPLHEREKSPKVRRRFYFKRTQSGAALAATFVASALVIFYLGLPGDKKSQKRVNGIGERPVARISIPQPTASGPAGLRPQSVSSIEDDGLGNQSTEPTPAKPDVHAYASTPNGAGVQALLEPAKTSPMAHSSGSANLSKKWSVQISAAPSKDIADILVRRLNAKGYDGYVVQTEVKGQTYYRVRVGHFDAREQAELVRQSLTRQEGYRDTFLTGD